MPKNPHIGHRISKARERKLTESNPTGSVSSRKLSIEDAPETIRDVEGELMGQVQIRLNNSVVRTIQQLKDASQANHGEGNVRILLNVLEEGKLKLTTVAHQVGEKMHLCS